ncbi:hypothetical protein L1987_57503 [Smallanthus sonchifolius]|uniref:Uncharacterized protein n=1 Tax=Smallanthus sonchifolius TaxID=185202 RepID=A0ACB9DDG5_9ASTR|nr:hypothetical protein L1987_57503 [Smallanthus sonchifolius]
MERDFMGLNSKKEAIEAVLLKSSAAQWSLSNGPGDLNDPQLVENQKNIKPHGPAQLTIFYNGTVNVFDDMSPEKARAIMLLASNGARAHTQVQAHSATPRTPVVDAIHVGQPMNKTLSSPVSVGPSTARDAPKVMSFLRRVIQSDVPQMRETSLARFLEKRRERIMASTPYGNKPGSSSAPSKDDQK